MNKPSDAFINNLKFVLISLVVTANAIEPLIGRSTGIRTLYQAIYTFHIPMFVFAMGLLAKDFHLEQRGIRSLAFIAWQYLLFQTVYSLSDAGLFHVPGVVHSFFVPYSLLWFLCSHFCWRVMLVPFLRLKRPLLTAVLLGVAIGYWPGSGTLLSLSRTFVFFPFFLAGYFVQVDGALLNTLRKWRLPATALTVLWLAVLALFGSRLPASWLYSNATYAEMGQNAAWLGALERLTIYGIQTLASTALLSWIPWTARSWTDRGKRTGYVFLLHGLLLKAVIASGIYSTWNTPLRMGIAFILAAALVTLLSQRSVERWAHPVLEPSFRLPNALLLKHKHVWK